MINMHACKCGKAEGVVLFSETKKDYVFWFKNSPNSRKEWFGPYYDINTAVNRLKDMVWG